MAAIFVNVFCEGKLSRFQNIPHLAHLLFESERLLDKYIDAGFNPEKFEKRNTRDGFKCAQVLISEPLHYKIYKEIVI